MKQNKSKVSWGVAEFSTFSSKTKRNNRYWKFQKHRAIFGIECTKTLIVWNVGEIFFFFFGQSSMVVSFIYRRACQSAYVKYTFTLQLQGIAGQGCNRFVSTISSIKLGCCTAQHTSHNENPNEWMNETHACHRTSNVKLPVALRNVQNGLCVFFSCVNHSIDNLIGFEWSLDVWCIA